MFSYVLKTLWRHRMRTVLTVAGTAVSLFVFCLVSSVQNGLYDLTMGAEADRSLIVFQENRVCPSTSRLPESYAREILKIDGVRDVIPIYVWTNNCRASLDVVVFNGAPPDQIRQHRPIELIHGQWNDFAQRRDAAIVGRNVAQRRNLKVGDQFAIGPMSVNIAGIFQSPSPAEENLIYTSLEYLQMAYGSEDRGLCTMHEVLLTDSADPDAVAQTIDDALRVAGVATKTRRKGAFRASAVTDLIDLIQFTNWLGYACIGLVLSIVATTTVMSVQDRLREYAVLQTIGVRPLQTIRLVLTESCLLCLWGGVLGVLIAQAVLYLRDLSITAEGVSIAIVPNAHLAITAIILSAAVGLIAGLAPSIQAATTSIVQALRHE